jgi:hypothetical protein
LARSANWMLLSVSPVERGALGPMAHRARGSGRAA